MKLKTPVFPGAELPAILICTLAILVTSTSSLAATTNPGAIVLDQPGDLAKRHRVHRR